MAEFERQDAHEQGIDELARGLQKDDIDHLDVDPSLLTPGLVDPLISANSAGSASYHNHTNHNYETLSMADLSDRLLERDASGVVTGWKEEELDQSLISNTSEDNIPALQYVSTLARIISQHPTLRRPENFPSYNTLTGIRTRLKGLSANGGVVKKEGEERCNLCKTSSRAKTSKVALSCWVQEGAWTSCAGCQSRGRSGDCQFSRSMKRKSELESWAGRDATFANVVELGKVVVENGNFVRGVAKAKELNEAELFIVQEFETKLREFEMMLHNVKGEEVGVERDSQETSGDAEVPPETLNSPRKKRKD